MQIASAKQHTPTRVLCEILVRCLTTHLHGAPRKQTHEAGEGEVAFDTTLSVDASFFGCSSQTNGFVVRDDTRKEIVWFFVELSASLIFWLVRPLLFAIIFQVSLSVHTIDLAMSLAPLKRTKPCDVHTGFQSAYNNVTTDLLNTFRTQLTSYPMYSIVVAGCSTIHFLIAK